MVDRLPDITGDAHISTEIWQVGQVLLLWYYASIPTHSVFQRIYMMTGHERKLTRLGLSEALLNFVLSVSLVLIFRNVVCVAIGSLIPTLYIGWVHLWPWLAKDAQLTRWQLFTKTMLPAWLACSPVLVLLSMVAFMPGLRFEQAWATLLTHGPIAGLFALALVWRFTLSDHERAVVTRKLRRHQPAAVLPAAIHEPA